MTIEDAVVVALADLWREVADENLPPNHCILGSRVAVEVGAYFGVPITARSTMVAAFNELAREWIGKPLKDWPKEAWSVGVGAEVEGPGYNGHVIAESEHWVIDLATGQFNRPKKGIEVGETLVVRKEANAAPDRMLTVVVENGCQLCYLPHADLTWRDAPDWKNRANWSAEVGAMIRLIKGKLHAA